jgi:hypothetical protein
MCAAFPYLCQAGFETNALDSDLAKTDTTSAGAIYHYTDLVQTHGFLPWRCAYCYVIDQALATTTESILTSAACNIADTKYFALGVALYLKGHVMTNGDRTTLISCIGTGEKRCVQLYYTTTGGLQILLTALENTAVGANPVAPISQNQWHWLELYGHVHSDGSGTGTLVMDGITVGSIGSLTDAAFTDVEFGVQNANAGHTAGITAFDDFMFAGQGDAAVRIGLRERFPINPHISAITTSTYSEHIFVGPGTVAECTLLTANAGDIIRLYDTDIGYSTGDYGVALVGEANFSSGYPVITGPLRFNRGCLAVITAAGASGARGIVRIDQDPPCGYPSSIYYGFPANLKRYAISHRPKFTQ